MANFIGGSANSMASQIAEGYFLINKNTLKGYTPGDLGSLKQELDKLLRETRAETPAQDDAQGNQQRNRRINRISSAMLILQNQMTQRR
jgi:hypothetical protein